LSTGKCTADGGGGGGGGVAGFAGGAWSESIYEFDGITGSRLQGGLTRDTFGVLYGVTNRGGTGNCVVTNCGTVFALTAPAAIVPHAHWFGEDQARYIVTVAAEQAGLVLAKMKGAGVPCVRIGTTGSDAVAIAGETPVLIASLRSGFEGWFPAYMNGKAS